DCAASAGNRANLSRTLGLLENRNAVRAARSDGRAKGERAGLIDGKIVAAVVLQNESGTDQAGYLAADGEGASRAIYLDHHVCRRRARTADDYASLRRRRRLSLDSDGVERVVGNRRREGNGSVRRNRQIVRAIILQH